MLIGKNRPLSIILGSSLLLLAILPAMSTSLSSSLSSSSCFSLHANTAGLFSRKKESIKGGNLPFESRSKIPDSVLALLKEFEKALEMDRLDTCRTLYTQIIPLQDTIPQETFFLAGLHLGRLEMLKGFSEQAISVLEALKPPEKDHLKLPFALLKARLYSQKNAKKALLEYQKALEISDKDQWDQEDQTYYSSFLRALERRWAQRMEQTTRLSAAGLYEEAMAKTDQLLADLAAGAHPKAPIGSEQYKILTWKWSAAKIKWLIDQERIDEAQLLIDSIDRDNLTSKGRLHRSLLLALTHALKGNLLLAERALESEEEPIYLQESLRLLKGRIYLTMGQGIGARALLKPILSSAHSENRILASIYMAQLQLQRGKTKEAISLLEDLHTLKEESLVEVFAKRNLLLAQLYEVAMKESPAESMRWKYQSLLIEILETKRVAHSSYLYAFALLLQESQNLLSLKTLDKSQLERGHYILDVLLSGALAITDSHKEITSDQALTLLQVVTGSSLPQKPLEKKLLSFLRTHSKWTAADKEQLSFAQEIAKLHLLTVDNKSADTRNAAWPLDRAGPASTAALQFKHPATKLRAQLLDPQNQVCHQEFFDKTTQTLSHLINLVEKNRSYATQQFFNIDTLLEYQTLLLHWLAQKESYINESVSLQSSIKNSIEQIHLLLEPRLHASNVPAPENLMVKSFFNGAIYLYMQDRDYAQYDLYVKALEKSDRAEELLYHLLCFTSPSAPWRDSTWEAAFEKSAIQRDSLHLRSCDRLLLPQEKTTQTSPLSDEQLRQVTLIKGRILTRLGKQDEATALFKELIAQLKNSSIEGIDDQSITSIALEAYSPAQYLKGDLEALAHLKMAVLDKKPYGKEHLIAYYYSLQSMQREKGDLHWRAPELPELPALPVLEELQEAEKVQETLLSQGDPSLKTDPQMWWFVHYFELEKALILIEQKKAPRGNHSSKGMRTGIKSNHRKKPIRGKFIQS